MDGYILRRQFPEKKGDHLSMLSRDLFGRPGKSAGEHDWFHISCFAREREKNKTNHIVYNLRKLCLSDSVCFLRAILRSLFDDQ